MRKILCLAVCFVLLSAASAQAADTIVVFDLQKVAADCDALKTAKDAMETKFGPQREELEKERAAIEKQGEGFQKKKPTEKQYNDFVKKQRDYQEKAQAFMRLLQADELRVRTDIDTVIMEAAKQMALANGYSIMLDTAAVPYVDPKLDVTEAVLTKANEVWKKMNEEGAAPKPEAAQQ